jgi:DNA-binding transcriptional ArsR family regulator
LPEACALADTPPLAFNPTMSASDPFFAEPAALMGDPARANILAALLDGRALTAKELAAAAGVTAQTTSGHLTRLTAANLITVLAQGRHRYFRLASPAVAQAIEALMVLAQVATNRHRPRTRASAELAAARTCYDHLAGRLGVGLHDALVARGALEVAEGGYGLSEDGRDLFAAMGIETAGLARPGRPLARPCLDWSERRTHLAGPLAAALACRCLELGWIERRPGSRAVRVTSLGERQFQDRLGLVLCEAVSSRAA